MNTTFQDLEDERNERNGLQLRDRLSVVELLDDLRSRPPFMCQFTGDNGYDLTVGIARDFGCIQHAANDGTPPFLMAVQSAGPQSAPGEMEFAVGGTATPIDGRYRLTMEMLKEVVAEFVATGRKSDRVDWEEF